MIKKNGDGVAAMNVVEVAIYLEQMNKIIATHAKETCTTFMKTKQKQTNLFQEIVMKVVKEMDAISVKEVYI